MRIAGFLMNFPDTALRIGLWGEAKARPGNQVNHLIIGQEIARIEIDPARSVPDNDLAQRKPVQNIGAILQKTVLHAPFVIVENRPVRPQEPQHFRKASTLPAHIIRMVHAIIMGRIAVLQGRPRPFAAAPVFQAIAAAVLDVIGRGGHHHLDRLGGQAGHHLQTIPGQNPAQRQWLCLAVLLLVILLHLRWLPVLCLAVCFSASASQSPRNRRARQITIS